MKEGGMEHAFLASYSSSYVRKAQPHIIFWVECVTRVWLKQEIHRQRCNDHREDPLEHLRRTLKTSIRKRGLHHPEQKYTAANKKAVACHKRVCSVDLSSLFRWILWDQSKSRLKNEANSGDSPGLSSNHPATKSLVDKKMMTRILTWETSKTQQYKHHNTCNPLNCNRNIGLSVKCRNSFCGSKRNGGGND